DTITAVFCGSKKSLVHGTVMSRVLFGSSAVMGTILLPLMIYHAAQLVIASILARQYSQRPG
ncbi:MAG: bile acid:sodium symporter, partial [Sphingobacteriales bacterium]